MGCFHVTEGRAKACSKCRLCAILRPSGGRPMGSATRGEAQRGTCEGRIAREGCRAVRGCAWRMGWVHGKRRVGFSFPRGFAACPAGRGGRRSQNASHRRLPLSPLVRKIRRPSLVRIIAPLVSLPGSSPPLGTPGFPGSGCQSLSPVPGCAGKIGRRATLGPFPRQPRRWRALNTHNPAC